MTDEEDNIRAALDNLDDPALRALLAAWNYCPRHIQEGLSKFAAQYVAGRRKK